MGEAGKGDELLREPRAKRMALGCLYAWDRFQVRVRVKASVREGDDGGDGDDDC